MTTMIPNVLAMPAAIARVFNRSSAIKQGDRQTAAQAKQDAPTIWANGMNLLSSIHDEEKANLEKIWNTQETEVKETAFGLLPVSPVNMAAIENTLAELSADERKEKKAAKPALPVGLMDLDNIPDEIANPEKAAALLGVSVDKLD